MKQFCSLLMFTCLLLITPKGYSAVICNNTNKCQGPATEMIDGILPAKQANGPIILITLPLEIKTQIGCSNALVSGGHNMKIEGDHPAFAESFSVLLAAFMSGRNIALRRDTTASSDECIFSYVSVLSN